MLSATYQQTSQPTSPEATRAEAFDSAQPPALAMKRRRLEVEAWRDAMLAVSGTLNRARGGPSLDLGDPKNNRRTLYGTVKRRELNDVLRLHDFPDPLTHSPSRLPTITPLQQLYTLNSPFVVNKPRLAKTAADRGSGDGYSAHSTGVLAAFRPPRDGGAASTRAGLSDACE